MTHRNIAIAAGVLLIAVAAITLLALSPWSGNTSAGAVLQGDVDCNQTIDTLDALGTLHKAADAPPFPACVDAAGDVDCDHDIDADDTVDILLYTVDPDRSQAAGDCTPIGQPIGSTATPGTLTPTADPTPTEPVTPTPSVTPTPQPTPQADAYRADPVLPASYLGAAADLAIELALMPGQPNVGIVATQDGYIYRVALDQASPTSLWGDLHTIVEYDQGEQGLLSVAFSPNFETDGRVYVYYSTGSPDPDETRLARLSATENSLDEDSLEVVLHIRDFAGNHNGGHIAFDNDGLLYLSTGDGGGADDPQDTGQNINELLGKVLRLDVSGASGYTNPPGNPFVGTSGADEIFAYGFRNPFRMTIDPVTDEVWLGDVGQGLREEVDHVTVGGNYGWDCREGDLGHTTDVNCSGKTFVEPRVAYPHSNPGGPDNQAVTGGVIYRGAAMPELYGWYIYADFYSGNVWAVDTEGPGAPVRLMVAPFATSSFTLAADGEVYFVSYSDGIYKLAR